MAHARVWVAVGLAVLVGGGTYGGSAAGEEAGLAGLLREQADAYVGLAEWCAAQGLPGDALVVFGEALRVVPDHERALTGWDAPPASPARDAAKKHGAAAERREKLEAGFLKPTLALGKRLAAAGDAEGAAAAWRRALDLDPESAEAQQGLGKALVKGVGWFPKATADKLKAGQRDLDGEWRPKAEVEKVRRQWDRAWEVETEHFLVRSNLPWEEVQALAGEAEDLCRAFLRVFGVAWRIPPATERMTIHCHATIEEFKSAVASVDPRAVNSPGFYNTNTAVSYFFKRDGYLTTVLHECTHQVMHRIASSSPGVTARPQFWLFEGLASYFETYEGPVSRPTFFRSSTPKLEGLRKMAASGSGVLSLAEFTALTQEGFMGKQDRYFQAMGLVHFLIEGEAGRFRRRFLEYARMVAAGEGTEASFTDAFGDDARAIESGWRASCR